MRTTLDIPDDLLRRAKILAVERGSTLREIVSRALQNELASPSARDSAPRKLPALRLDPAAPVLHMKPEDISLALHAANLEDDAARAG